MSDTPQSVSFTKAAARQVRSLAAEQGNPDLNLRVYVTGGGCSGFQYGFEFDNNIGEDDTRVKKHGASLLVDPLSYPYLCGAEVDFTAGLDGEHFVIRNPNAQATCGCGSSFAA